VPFVLVLRSVVNSSTYFSCDLCSLVVDTSSEIAVNLSVDPGYRPAANPFALLLGRFEFLGSGRFACRILLL